MIITNFAWSAERKSCVLALEFRAETLEEARTLADLLIGKADLSNLNPSGLTDDDDPEWIDTGKLAGLPKMPCSSQGVLRKAKREKWLMRIKPNYAKWNQIHISNLPLATVEALRGKL